MGVFEALKTFFSVLVKFFSVVLIMVVIALISFEGVTYYITGNLYDFRKNADKAAESKTEVNVENASSEHEDSYNSILFYTDAERNYFDIRIILLNTKTGFTDVVLLPSCSKISVSGKLLTSLKKEVDVTGNQVCLEEIYRSYGDKKYEVMEAVISQAFGMDFQVCDTMTSDQMEKLLDMADDVTVPLKNDITYRNKENVLKVLNAGDQELTAKKALSYMNYTNGTDSQEVNRLENIATYLTAYFEKVLDKNTEKELYIAYKGSVTASADRDDEKIIEALKGITVDGISIRVLQGSEENGVYTIDSQKAKLQLSGLMTQAAAYSNDGTSAKRDFDETIGDSKGYSIELYNAGYIAGLAGSWRDYLEEQGYTISLIDNYREGTLATTEIVVNKEGLGQDFLRYFPNAEIKIEEISTGGDIRIYLGTDSAYMVSGYEDTRPEGVVLEGEESSEESEDTELSIENEEMSGEED